MRPTFRKPRAALAAGSTTPKTGTERSSARSGRAAELAVLQATTMAFTPCLRRKPAISQAKRRTMARGLPP